MSKIEVKKSTENLFNRMLNYSFITAGLSFILGLILLFLPNITNKVVGILVGISFLVTGIGAIYNYFHREGAKLYSLNLVFGILFAILGIVIILYPFTVMSFVTICLGLYMIVSGCMKINYSFWFKRGSEDCWLVTLVTGILLIIFGIMVLVNPFSSLTLTKLAGIFLIIISVLDVMDTYMFKKRSKEIMDIFW
ncbi:MAG: DUF308 domain-containing protein [Bacilli bacterium]